MQSVPFPGKTPYPRNLSLWEPEDEPRAVVLFSHGMAEHIARYEWLGQALAKEGFLCAGYNHLGHGAEAPRPGWFSEENGWGKAVEDLHTVMRYLSGKAPSRKRILLGHSMGSFLAREYVLRFPDGLDALILSGSGWHPKALCLVASALAKAQVLLGQGKKPSKLLDKLAFSANNKPFAVPGGSKYAWLSRDKEIVAKYEQDPYCGFVFTASGFLDLFKGLDALADTDRFSAIRKDLPVYFLSGKNDPVGKFGEGIRVLAEQYRAAGLKDVSLALYEGARHELFNETNKTEVVNDMLKWISRHVLEGGS